MRDKSLSFESWYRDTHGRLVASLIALSGDADVAKEAVDEAFVRAYTRWDRVSEMKSPRAWTYKVALNELRRMKRRSWHQVAASPQSYEGPAVEIWLLVQDLPRRQRTAIVLRHVADLKEREIATSMGITRGTVSATLRQGYQRLRSQIEISEPLPGGTM